MNIILGIIGVLILIYGICCIITIIGTSRGVSGIHKKMLRMKLRGGEIEWNK